MAGDQGILDQREQARWTDLARALASGRALAEAADAIGVPRPDARRIFADPRFRRGLDEIREATGSRRMFDMELAQDMLMEAWESAESPADRIRAVKELARLADVRPRTAVVIDEKGERRADLEAMSDEDLRRLVAKPR